jgi:hypothetical protein
MIPEIGMMIGAYIVAKLVYISGKDDASSLTKILSVVTILVAVFVVGDLMVRGSSFSAGLPNIR